MPFDISYLALLVSRAIGPRSGLYQNTSFLGSPPPLDPRMNYKTTMRSVMP